MEPQTRASSLSVSLDPRLLGVTQTKMVDLAFPSSQSFLISHSSHSTS